MSESGTATEEETGQIERQQLSEAEIKAKASSLNTELADVLSKLPQWLQAPNLSEIKEIDERMFTLGEDKYQIMDLSKAGERFDGAGYRIIRIPNGYDQRKAPLEWAQWAEGTDLDGDKPVIVFNEQQARVKREENNQNAVSSTDALVNRLKTDMPVATVSQPST